MIFYISNLSAAHYTKKILNQRRKKNVYFLLSNSQDSRHHIPNTNNCFIISLQIGRFTKYPCIKFIGHAMSFGTFLIMIVVSSVSEMPSTTNRYISKHERKSVYNHYTDYRNDLTFHRGNSTDILPCDFALRTFKPEIIHLLLSIWIVGKHILYKITCCCNRSISVVDFS